MKTIIRTALFFVMLIPIAAGALYALAAVGATAGFTGTVNYVSDLFDRWS